MLNYCYEILVCWTVKIFHKLIFDQLQLQLHHWLESFESFETRETNHQSCCPVKQRIGPPSKVIFQAMKKIRWRYNAKTRQESFMGSPSARLHWCYGFTWRIRLSSCTPLFTNWYWRQTMEFGLSFFCLHFSLAFSFCFNEMTTVCWSYDTFLFWYLVRRWNETTAPHFPREFGNGKECGSEMIRDRIWWRTDGLSFWIGWKSGRLANDLIKTKTSTENDVYCKTSNN